MRAVSTVGGGVMFIPDEIETKTKSISYKKLVKETITTATEKTKIFGKRKPANSDAKKAA